MNKKRVLSIFAILLVVALGLSVQTAFADNGNPPGQTKIMTRPEGASSPIGAPASYPPLPTPLISNLSPGTSMGVSIASTAYMAAGFTTPATGSYTIGSARLNLIESDNSCNLYAYIYSNNAGVPGSAVATFTPLYVAAFNNWDAEFDIFLTAPYTLSASTTYWLVWTSDCPTWTPFWGQDNSVAPSGIFTYVGNLDNFGGGWQLPVFGGYKKWALYPAVPKVGLNTTSLNFGNQLVGSGSATQDVWVTNTGGADLHISSINLSGDFGYTFEDCVGATLAPGNFCSISVYFAPTTIGYQTGQLAIYSDAASSPDIVALDGTGVSIPAGTNLLLNPGFDAFGSAPKAWQYSVLNVPLSSLADCANYLSPACSLKLTASHTTKIVTQTVSYNGTGGQSFIYGLSTAALNVIAGGTYKVEIALFNRFNRVMYTQYLTFVDGTHAWETEHGYFTAPANFTKMRYRIYFQKSVGTAWFDDAFLMLWP